MKHGRNVFGKVIIMCVLLAVLVPTLRQTAVAQRPAATPTPTPGPMLDQGVINLNTPEFSLDLLRSSQTVAALKPKVSNSSEFDFTPGDLLKERSQDGYYHLGDLDLRLRAGSSGEWKSYSTAFARKPVSALAGTGKVLAASDLSPTLPQEIPLRITRAWLVEDRQLVLRFTLKNRSKQSVQIGALGIPMVFNNILNDRTLEQAHARCVF